jgi:hypothetical protein
MSKKSADPMATLVAAIPASLIGSYDSAYHKTPADLAFMAQTELDLADEGEIQLTANMRRQIEAFRLRAAVAK